MLRRPRIEERDPYVQAFRAHISAEDGILLTGNILQELLDGLRNKKDFDRLQQILEPFPLVPLNRGIYVAAAEIRQRCRFHGIQAGPIDCLIAAACIDHGFPLLTSDRDFTYIAQHSDLVLPEDASGGL
ncbi:MAG: PIN domain-containing protein [Nitrospirales bacterium]|nr:PIN domain-containing protein [Nitrospirales bacterium]